MKLGGSEFCPESIKNNMKNIMISGSSGLVGSRIVELLKNDFNFIPLIASEVDITDLEKVKNFINENDFDIFLHLAAYTNVNGAELEKELAHKINVEGTKNVFDCVNVKNKKFLYISTDFVFAGDDKDKIYLETDTPNPGGVYGKTKYQGEKIVNGKGMIVRISYPYRAQFEEKKDFVASIKSILENGQEIKVVTDSIFTPTFIDDIAYGLKHLLNNFEINTYHLAGSRFISPYDAIKLIANKFHFNTNLVMPTTFINYFKEYASIRPQYSAIKSINNNFYKMKSFEEGLDEIIRQLN